MNQVDKVYVVNAGEYEDYHIICLFNNRLDAERYVALYQSDGDNMMFY